MTSTNSSYIRLIRTFARVTPKHRCPICGKPNWCTYTTDGALAFCMRQPAGSVKQARNNAYIHVLQDDPNWRESVKKTSAATASHIPTGASGGSERADADRLNEVYTYLLEWCLGLTSAHREHLFNERRLSIATVAENLYASVPERDAWLDVCRAMQERFTEGLHGIPGFYKDTKGRWRMRHDNYMAGFFVPYRDARGRIVGLQIRLDKPLVKTKYLWFATPPENFSHGTGSGSPIHFARPERAKQSGSAVLIEGALKADIVCGWWDVAVIAFAGSSGFNAEAKLAKIRRQLPELKKLVVAFDADWKENAAVRGGLKRLLEAIPASGLESEVLEWDISDGKGLDDVLNNMETMKGNNNA